MAKTKKQRQAVPRGGKNDNKKKNHKESTTKDDPTDWIASLVKQSASGNDTNILSKEGRKQKREAKKARRLQQKEEKLQQRKGNPVKHDPATTTTKMSSQRLVLELSKRRLYLLSRIVQDARQGVYDHLKNLSGNNDDGDVRPKRPRPYNASAAAKTMAAALKKRKRKWSEESVQPRPSDYSGMGYARDTLYIELEDPSYFPKLEEEFQEHIPGFFGKQRTKAVKRQTDGNMLWRQLANNKHNMSKKLKSMSPDERVQAMIDSGMI